MSLYDWSSYPRRDVRWDGDEPVFTTVTREDVARTCMARVFFFGLRDPADEFVRGELELALHLCGVLDAS